jgi:WD40 repeat protein
MTIVKRLPYIVILMGLLFSVFSTQSQSLFPEEPPASRLDWHPDGQWIAMSDGVATVRIVDATTLATLNTLPQFPAFVSAVRWSDTGNQLAIASEWSVQIWEQPWDTLQATLILTLEVPQEQRRFTIQSIDWNEADQQILAIASPRGFMWNVQTGQLLRTLEPNKTPVLSGVWSDDGNRLGIGYVTGYVLVEELATQEIGGEDTLDGDGVHVLAWSPNGDQVAVGTNSGLIEFFAGTGRQFSGIGPILETDSRILSLDWHPTASLLAVGTLNGKVEVWNTASESIVSSVVTGTPVVSVVWSPDGATLAYNNGTNLATIPMPVIPTATLPLLPNTSILKAIDRISVLLWHLFIHAD